MKVPCLVDEEGSLREVEFHLATEGTWEVLGWIKKACVAQALLNLLNGRGRKGCHFNKLIMMSI
jgi:hypothetical protein